MSLLTKKNIKTLKRIRRFNTSGISVFSIQEKRKDIEEARMLMKDSDNDIKELAETEYENLKTKIEELEIDLKNYYRKILMTLKMFSLR